MSVDLQRLCWRIEFPTPAMSAVAVKLADCANDEGENVYPSVGRIERETRLGASTVRRVLAAFEEAGLLEVIMEAHGNRWLRSTTVRRFNVGLLHALSAVEVRRGKVLEYAPSTHLLKEIDVDGRKRWAIVERTLDDPSDYRASDATLLEPAAVSTPPAAGGVDDRHPSRSGRGPLPQREPTPPAAGAKPSEEYNTPLTPHGGDQGEHSKSDKRDAASAALDSLRAGGRHPAVVEHLLAPVFAAKRVRGAGKAEDVAALAGRARDLASPLLARAARLVLDQPGDTSLARLAEAVDQVRKGGLMIPIRPGQPQWAAWLAHFEASSPKTASLMRRYGGWQVPSDWPPRSSVARGDSDFAEPAAARAGGAGGAA